MKINVTGLINNLGTVLGPIEATTRHMTIEIFGEPGIITGAKSVLGDVFTDMDTYSFNGPKETFDIDVNCPGTIIQLTTTGIINKAYLITEG